jgi:hypothetical protein
MLSLTLSGCQSPAPPAAPLTPARDSSAAPATTASAVNTPEILGLLDAADAAWRDKHLIYPAQGSAMTLYYEILQRSPGNAEALRGLERLVEQFLGLASVALERAQYTKAGAMISRARLVDPDNPNIEPMAVQLRLLENAHREKVTLDWRKLANRSSELGPVLRRIGTLAKREGCRATISVSNDAEGRWVYQQMSRAPGDARIRAQTRIASPAAVEVLCF